MGNKDLLPFAKKVRVVGPPENVPGPLHGKGVAIVLPRLGKRFDDCRMGCEKLRLCADAIFLAEHDQYNRGEFVHHLLIVIKRILPLREHGVAHFMENRENDSVRDFFFVAEDLVEFLRVFPAKENLGRSGECPGLSAFSKTNGEMLENKYPVQLLAEILDVLGSGFQGNLGGALVSVCPFGGGGRAPREAVTATFIWRESRPERLSKMM